MESRQMLETDVNFSGEKGISQVNQLYTRKSDRNEGNNRKISKLLPGEGTIFNFRRSGQSTQRNFV